MKRRVVRGLKKEYVPFVTSIQGWAVQPSLVEFENLLAGQESLAKQMVVFQFLMVMEMPYSLKIKSLRRSSLNQVIKSLHLNLMEIKKATKTLHVIDVGKLGIFERIAE